MQHLLALVAAALGQPQQAAPAQEAPAAPKPATLEDRLKALDTIDLSDDPAARLAEMQALMVDARAAGNVSTDNLASIQANIGGALFYQRKYAEAVAAVDEAGRILEAGGLGEGEAAASFLSNGATILADMGKYEESLVRHRKALAIRRKLEGERGPYVGSSTFGVGYVLFRQGKIEESLDWLKRGAEMQLEFGREGDPLNVVRQTSYASVLGTAGYLEQSVVEARKAVEYAEAKLPEGHQMRGFALNNLGTALDRTGQYAEAEAVFRRALDLRVAIHGKDHPNAALALKNLSTALFRNGRIEEADALLMQAAKIYEASKETNDPTALGVIWENGAAMAAARGDTAVQEQRLRKAIAELETKAGADHVALVGPQRELANLLAARGTLAEASALAHSAAAIARRALQPDHGERTAAEIVEGLILAAAGEPDRGFAMAEAAAQAIERKMLDFATSRYEAIGSGPLMERSLARFAALALETGHKDAAFRAVQLANLTDTAATSGAVAARAAAGNPRAEQLARALQDQARKGQLLRSGQAKALAAKDEPEAMRLSREIDANDARLRATGIELDARFPEYRTLSRPAPVTLAAYRAGLPAGSALVAPLVVDDRLLTIAVTRDGLSWARSGASPNEVAAAVANVRASIDEPGRGFDRADAFALYQAVFPPTVERALAKADTLELFGGGPLASLPLGLLVTRRPEGNDADPEALRRTAWLVRDKAVSVPVTLLASPAPKSGGSVRQRFAGFGGPRLAAPSAKVELAGLYRGGAVDVEAVRDLPSLPQADAELRKMGQALGDKGALVVTGAAATESAVRGADLSRASVLAFATHGLVSGEMAGVGEPALVFTPPASPTEGDDGLLTASEISTLKLDADWVILSACNTAAGTGGASPNYSGLARAFIHAGGRTLLLSHWNVRDDAAARLTVDTVRNSATVSRPQALRKAMLALIDDASVPGGAHPAVWAPFVLIGQ